MKKLEAKKYNKENNPAYVHGYALKGNHHNLYDRWLNIKSRCYNPQHQAYYRYGGRGIKMYADWIYNPSLFIDYCLRNGYDINLTIDRINNNGDYEPGNIRFVTQKENNRNGRGHLRMNMVRAGVVRILYRNGFKQRDIAKLYGVSQRTVFDILQNTKWI